MPKLFSARGSRATDGSRVDFLRLLLVQAGVQYKDIGISSRAELERLPFRDGNTVFRDK